MEISVKINYDNAILDLTPTKICEALNKYWNYTVDFTAWELPEEDRRKENDERDN